MFVCLFSLFGFVPSHLTVLRLRTSLYEAVSGDYIPISVLTHKFGFVLFFSSAFHEVRAVLSQLFVATGSSN